MIGKTISHYKIIEKLGEGCMGSARTSTGARASQRSSANENRLSGSFAEHSPGGYIYSYSADLQSDPDLEPLRDYPPFLELLRPKG